MHLKGGIADALLYRATMMLTVGGKIFGMLDLQIGNNKDYEQLHSFYYVSILTRKTVSSI